MGINKKNRKEFWIDTAINWGVPSIIAFFIGIMSFDKSTGWTQQTLIISLLGFIIPLIVIDVLQRQRKEYNGSIIKREDFITQSLDTADMAISGLVSHLAADCYTRCSENSDKCNNSCTNFKNKKCNGLLRNYLLKTSNALLKAIEHYKKGQFELTTNIRDFHTLAINHLIGYKGTTYCVMHCIGNNERFEENYDNLDCHFLYTLLEKVTKKVSGSSYQKNQDFKIKWLLIGDSTKMKNNYDYIFWVANKLNNSILQQLDTFFEFYILSQEDYNTKKTTPLTDITIQWVKEQVEDEPSIGIFSDYFMFIDAEKKDVHGTIYTRMHEKTSTTDSVTETKNYFDKIIQDIDVTKFSDLNTIYNQLLSEDSTHKQTLDERCELN